jgi:uncharacterized protein with PIN domain
MEMSSILRRITRSLFEQEPLPSFKTLFKRSVKRQRMVIRTVEGTKCPKCAGKLHPAGYENDHALTHYEVAVVCTGCSSKFVMNEHGLKGEYAYEHERSV